MSGLWRKITNKVKSVPRWGLMFGIALFAIEVFLYVVGGIVSRYIGTEIPLFDCKIPVIDDRIPILPGFALIYVFSFVFWPLGSVAVSMTEKRNIVNYTVGLTLGFLIGFVLFIFAPTVMDRRQEGLLAIAEQPGFFHWLLRIIYWFDGYETGRNLFPSYHCLLSTYCYLGVRKQKEIPKAFRVYTLVMAILICLSTLFIKQHYFADVPGGIGIAVLCYILIGWIDPGRRWKIRLPR